MKVPKLRFKDDDGQEFPEWEKKTIDDLVNAKIILKPLDGNHGELHPKSSDYVDIGIPFIMANDIRNSVVDIEGAKKISKTQADKLQKGFSLESDVLLTHKGSVGFVAIVPKLSSDYIMLTPQVTYYRVVNKEKLSNVFLANNFISPNFQKEFTLLSGGGTRAYLGITEQRNLKLHVPCISEQTKIANFLTAVDEKITQLTQKHDLLKQYKKGVMQQIFSQKLRFKDDDGREFPEWEELVLADICEFKNGKAHESIISDDGKYFVINSKFISSEGTIYKKTDLALAPIEKDSVVIVMSDVPNGKALAKCFHISTNNLFTLNQRIGSLRSNQHNNKFIYYQINRNPYYLSFDSGVGQTNLKRNEILGCPILLPKSVKEQTKIANFLTAIDDKITQAQAQLEAIKRYKKGLLQQLFV